MPKPRERRPYLARRRVEDLLAHVKRSFRAFAGDIAAGADRTHGTFSTIECYCASCGTAHSLAAGMIPL